MAVVFADLGDERYAAILGKTANRSMKADRPGNPLRQPGKRSLSPGSLAFMLMVEHNGKNTN
jgi:hypothetical protein